MLKELSEKYEVVAVSSPGEDLEIVKNREGVRAVEVPMERHISLFKDLKSLLELIKVFSKEKPYMVHSMTPKAGLLCMMAAWMARVPVRIHTFTGLIWPTSTGLKRQILMLTDRITCACASHVIPESLGVLNDLKNHGITQKPLKVLGYGNVKGVDLSFWRRTNPECKIDNDAASVDDPFTLLFVGRIVGDKGINELVAAFSKLIERKKAKGEGRNIRLVLVGWIEDHLDPVTPETRQLIDSMPEIEAVGPKPVSALLDYYAAADCFVFPSYREGFPNTVLEAGAMELASIVTDINGSREIICKTENLSTSNNKYQILNNKLDIRENGVVIPSKDVDALYEAMLWMMEHDEERETMGKRAREIVSERWEQGFVREKLYEFYREVLSNSIGS